MPEQDIVQLLNSRDRRGAEELLTHYGALMRYIISPILPNAQDAEECLSEVFMRVWDKIEQYDPERGSFKAWLTALTRNTALNYARKIKNSGNEEELYSELPSPEPTRRNYLCSRREARLWHRRSDFFLTKRGFFFTGNITTCSRPHRLHPNQV